MRIDKVALKDIDPLKIFTERSLVPDREREEKEEGDESEEQDKKRIAEIWASITKDNDDSRPGPLRDLFHMGPDLADLATLLNREDVQILLADILAAGEKKDSSPEKREMSSRVKRNLEALNGKIGRANSIWYRRLPLPLRVLWQIDRIKIPVKGTELS